MNKYLFFLILLMGVTVRMSFGQAMSMPMGEIRPVQHIFLRQMDTMMTKMDGAKLTGSAGADFLLQMIPHHEGAISMADEEIKFGQNHDMIQLAKSIKAEQTTEIQLMKILLSRFPADSGPVPDSYVPVMTKVMETMMDNMPANKMLTNTDRSFAMVMVPHHQAAIDMARVILTYSTDQQISTFAKQLISNEQIEIEQMSSFIK